MTTTEWVRLFVLIFVMAFIYGVGMAVGHLSAERHDSSNPRTLVNEIGDWTIFAFLAVVFAIGYYAALYEYPEG